MKTVYPDYYKDFKCIAGRCMHSCCIGWEIDIDKSSLSLYQNLQGDFGKRLRDNISLEGTPHFILAENERCPFLNDKNLCDVYTNLGKDKLCSICSEHPRFYNELSDRLEAGLGLCCEEAARLIITKKEPFKLIGEEEAPEGILKLRKKVFEALQNRKLTILKRLENVCSVLEIPAQSFDVLEWAEVFEGLERLDESWSRLLHQLKENYKKADMQSFADFMKNREAEYEQFLCYLVYRHASKAEFWEDFALYTLFAILSFQLVYAMGASIFAETGDFTVKKQLDIMRLFSSEIEYSDENLDIILNKLETGFFGY